jgi:hypothetical protein
MNIDQLKKRFPDDDACRRFFESILWKNCFVANPIWATIIDVCVRAMVPESDHGNRT